MATLGIGRWDQPSQTMCALAGYESGDSGRGVGRSRTPLRPSTLAIDEALVPEFEVYQSPQTATERLLMVEQELDFPRIDNASLP